MRNLLLSAALIAVPVGLFAAGYSLLAPPPVPAAAPIAVAPRLGDMTPFRTITNDVRTIAAKGDLAAAETRITDLETAWDDAAKTLRAIDIAAWGNVDATLDDALAALRAKAPDPAMVMAALAALSASLDDPSRAAGAAAPATPVYGIAVTGPNGRPLPCEVMLEQFRAARAAATTRSEAERAQSDALEAKGTERCNADDDARADDFFAQGIALMSN